MSIKNKDGTIYKLSGPNPLMKEQSDWNKENIQIFNLKHEKEIIKNTLLNEENVVFIKNTLLNEENVVFIKNNKNISPKEFIEEIKEEILLEKDNIPENSVPQEQKTLNIPKEKISNFYCAPAIGKITHRNELYDESYTTTKYGDKFLFEAVILEQSDFQMLFWSTKIISENSIIYRKISEGGERWWRVLEAEEKSGGYLIKCNLSDLNPSFS